MTRQGISGRLIFTQPIIRIFVDTYTGVAILYFIILYKIRANHATTASNAPGRPRASRVYVHVVVRHPIRGGG